jgi:threonine aldolase
MVFFSAKKQKQLVDFLAEKNIIISNRKVIRLVFHLDVTADDVLTVIAAVNEFYRAKA